MDAGGDLQGVAAIFTYGLPVAKAQFDAAAMAFATLTDFTTLMEVATERGTLTEEQSAIIASWQEDPAAWSVARGGKG